MTVSAAVPAGTTPDVEPPQLVIVIAVDQLRNDRLEAGSSGGLGRLVREGRRFPDSMLDHGISSTCPGHATLITGLFPSGTGIPGNDYVDRREWLRRYCVDDDDPAHRIVGGSEGRSPWMLRASGLGDWLKNADSAARVYSVGGKDRSAIMLGGLQADAAFWFDAEQAAFTTSGYYSEGLPDYLVRYNDALLRSLPATWEHPPGPWREDDFPGESDENSSVSGHPLTSGDEPGRQIAQSPFLDQLTFDVARLMVQQERLGRNGHLDMLAIAASAVDKVGHLYGPFSAESEDTLRALDRNLGQFLSFLDAEVGRGRYVIALSADHGVTDLPEWSSAQGTNQCPVDGGRLSIPGLLVRVYGSIYWRYTFPFDSPSQLLTIAGPQIYLNTRYLREQGLDYGEVVAGIRQLLEATPGVKRVWTVPEVEQGTSDEARLLRNSLVPDRAGDLIVQLYPDCLLSEAGTNHGSLYRPDRDVPLVFFGQGVSPGQDPRPARSVDLAPTLAHLLGIAAPAGLDGAVLPLSAVHDRRQARNHQ